MIKIKKWLKRSDILIKIRLILELFNEYKRLSKHLGAVGLMKNKTKLEADIAIRFHAIEKGLSMSNPRVGFGEKKVDELLNILFYYQIKFSDDRFIHQALSVLESYFNFNDKNDYSNKALKDSFQKLKFKTSDIKSICLGGTIQINKKEIESSLQFNFEKFINSRYSIRDFSTESVDEETIYKAIEIAKKTPSACNRQPWRVHVFRDKKIKKELLDWQGNRGFTDNIDTAIIITCSLNSFFISERHQAYVDGGLYAMTLMLAFHSLGIGTIPMTLGMMSSKMNVLYKKYGILEDELPIVMIGVGNLKNTFEVAISERKNIKEYVRFI